MWDAEFEVLRQHYRVIRYDARGTGLSQRGVMDFSLAALQLDLDAVINRLDVDRVSTAIAIYGDHGTSNCTSDS